MTRSTLKWSIHLKIEFQVKQSDKVRVVANIKMGIFKAKFRKGSMST